MTIPQGVVWIAHPGDAGDSGSTPSISFFKNSSGLGEVTLDYTVEDAAPNRVLNGVELDESNPTHRARSDHASITIDIR